MVKMIGVFLTFVCVIAICYGFFVTSTKAERSFVFKTVGLVAIFAVLASIFLYIIVVLF